MRDTVPTSIDPTLIKEANRKKYAATDALSLVARFNFPSAVSREPQWDRQYRKTRYHELTHAYQMFSTTYGHYWTSLRLLQSAQTLGLIRRLNEMGASIRLPLLDFVVQLQPKRKYEELWRILYPWFLAEYLLCFLEGDFDRMVLYDERFLRENSFYGHLLDLDQFMLELRDGSEIELGAPELSRAAVNGTKVLLAQKGFAGLDTRLVLEAGGKLAEFRHLDDERPMEELSSEWSHPNYSLLTLAMWTLGNTHQARFFALSVGALVDLALQGSLIPPLRSFRHSDPSGLDLEPLSRFHRALGAARDLPPIRDLQSDYQPFVGAVCERLGWPTPWDVHRYLNEQFVGDVDSYSTLIRLEAHRFQMTFPGIFLDVYTLCRDDHISARMNRVFCHPACEFDDLVEFDSNQDRVDEFLNIYVLHHALEQALLRKTVNVVLPFRLPESTMRSMTAEFADALGSTGLGEIPFQLSCEEALGHPT